MSLLDELKSYARYTTGLYGYLRHPMTIEDAERIVRERMEQREENFLRLLRRSIYGHARSPYLALLRHAGCQLGDVERMVSTHGLEVTLKSLRQAGVYVTLEEFKGRVPLVRNDFAVATKAHDFDNPFLAHHIYAESGGSTGTASRTPSDVDHLAATIPHNILSYSAQGVLEAPMAVWRGILPDGSGIKHVLHSTKTGHRADRWFSQIPWWDTRRSLKYSLATAYIVAAARLMGASIPWPSYVPVDRADIIARWVATTVKAYGTCLLATQVSRALRVALAAEEAALDLAGTVFSIAGEPATPAKVHAIERRGIRIFTYYGMAGVGRIGMGCARADDRTDVHLNKDGFVLFTHPQPVDGDGMSVPAFNVTTLLSTTPKIMLNVVVDDYGIVAVPLRTWGLRRICARSIARRS